MGTTSAKTKLFPNSVVISSTKSPLKMFPKYEICLVYCIASFSNPI